MEIKEEITTIRNINIILSPAEYTLFAQMVDYVFMNAEEHTPIHNQASNFIRTIEGE